MQPQSTQPHPTQAAYDAGYEAAWSPNPINPHAIQSVEWFAWSQGLEDGNAEIKDFQDAMEHLMQCNVLISEARR